MADQFSDLSLTVETDSRLPLRGQYQQTLADLKAAIAQPKADSEKFLDVGQDVLQSLSDSGVGTLSETEAFQRVTDDFLRRKNINEGALSSRLAAALCKVAPLFNIALGISGFAAEASGFAPLGLVATGLGALLDTALRGIERSEAIVARLNKLPRIRDQVQEVINANQNDDEDIVDATFELMIALNFYLRDSLVHLSKNRVSRALDGLGVSRVDESGAALDDARKAFEQVLQHKATAILLTWKGTEQRRDLLAWFNVLDFAAARKGYFRAACDGTGVWFLEADETRRFRDGNLLWLWCEGRAGVGKSTLVAQLLHEMEHPSSSHPVRKQNLLLAYAFCSINDQQRQDLKNILRSFVGQIVEAQYSRMQRAAQDFRRDHSAVEPNVEDYVQFLGRNIPSTHSLVVVIDALDELSRGLHYTLFGALRDLRRLLGKRLRVLVMTRPIKGFSWRLDSDDELLNIKSSISDLRIYLEAKIQEDPPLWDLDAQTRGKVIDTIIKKADKRFILGKVQLASLYDPRVYSVGDLEDRLDSLTLQLDKFYDKSLKFIGGMGEETSNPEARPLSAQELRHAIAIKPGQTSNLAILQKYMANLAHLVESSGSLCDFAQSGSTISFTHPTVQEYLMTRPELKVSELAVYKCQACIQYLSIDEFKTGACTKMWQWLARLEEFPFLEYAARNWCIIRGMTDDWEAVNKALESAIIELLVDAELVSSLQQVIGYSQGRMSDKKIYVPQTTGLIIAMQFNLLNVMEKICESGVDVNARTERGQTALDLAVTASPDFVKLLLRYGAQVKDHSGRNALRLALFDFPTRQMRGGVDIIRKLVAEDPFAVSVGNKEEIEMCFGQIEWLRNQTMMEAERTFDKQVQMEFILELLGLDKDGPKPPWWK